MDFIPSNPGWGTLLGQGISQGLASLADRQLQQMAKDQKVAGLKSLGFTDEQSKALSGFSDSALAPIIKQQMQAPASAYFQSELDRTSGEPTNNAQAPGGMPMENTMQGNMAAEPKQNTRKVPALSDRQKEVLAAHKLKASSNKMKLHEQSIKYSEPFISSAKSSERNKHEYKTIRELLKAGELTTGRGRRLAQRLGIEDYINTPADELAGKIFARLGLNYGSAFPNGTNLNQFLEKSFGKTVPDLYKTPEGIYAILEGAEALDDISILENKARGEILKKNDGIWPYDMTEQIQEKIAPQVKSIQDKALNDMLNYATQDKQKSLLRNAKSLGMVNLPDPKDANPKMAYKDPETGKLLVTNGKKWVEYGK